MQIGKKLNPYIHESNNYAVLDLNSYNSLNGYFKCLITLLPLLDDDDDIKKIIKILKRSTYHHHSFHGHDGNKNLLIFFNDKNIDEQYKQAIDKNLRKKILEEKNSDKKEKWLGFDSILSFYYKFVFLNIQSINEKKQYSIDLLAKQIFFLFDLKENTINIIDYCMEKQISINVFKTLIQKFEEKHPELSELISIKIKKIEKKEKEEITGYGKKLKSGNQHKGTFPHTISIILRNEKNVAEKKRKKKLNKILAKMSKSSNSS
jgi:hypothetical protein